MLLLFGLALFLSANTAFAATNTKTNVTNQNIDQINQVNGQNLDKNTVESSGQQKTTKSIQKAGKNAAGSTSSTKTVAKPKTFTKNQINDAASRVNSYISKNKRLPSSVTISSVKVTMPQFLGLLANNVLNKERKLQKVASPSGTTQKLKTGKLTKSNYLKVAKLVRSKISSTGKAPGYINTSLGKMKYHSLIYTFTKVSSFQKSNKRLPNYVSVTSWKIGGSKTVTKKSTSISEGAPSKSTSTVSKAMQKYLKVTKNAQSNNSTIKKLAASITKGKTTTSAKAKAIFNWVRDHLTYSYYYDTKRGALGALKARTGNCVDTSHLVVALSRAAKIPAQYKHGTCKFSSGWYGHVWAQMYVNGKWYNADAISNRNSLGSIKNWSSAKMKGTYISLPF